MWPSSIGKAHELTKLELAELITFRSLPEDAPTRAREELGWPPQVPFAGGIAETVPWFRAVLAEEDAGYRSEVCHRDMGGVREPVGPTQTSADRVLRDTEDR